MSLVSAVKRARQEANLTLTEVARRSGLQVSNLSAIEAGTREPRVETVEKALRATGKKFIAVPFARMSVAELAEELAVELMRGRRNDLTRFAIQASDNLVGASSVEELYALVIEPAPTTGNQHWDALLAAIVEYRLNQRKWPVPEWAFLSVVKTRQPEATLPWPGTREGYDALRTYETTSPEFTRRGIWFPISTLESV